MERIFLFTLILFLFACDEKPIPNPELSDLIFKDLVTEAKTAEANYGQLLKENNDLKQSLSVLPPRDPGKERLKQQVLASNQKLLMAATSREYFKLRAEMRLNYIKQTYPKYFAERRSWPDQSEYQQYQTNKKLRTAPREWSAHLPKLEKPGSEKHTQQKKEAKKEAGH